MARARNIKPGFFTNEQLVELGFDRRLLFIGLWTLADREGRLEDRPKHIKMAIFPADDVNVDKALEELQSANLILRYEAGAKHYIQVLTFLKHQNPHHREPPSIIPKPEALPMLQHHQSPGPDGNGNSGEPQASPTSQPPPAQGQPQASPSSAVLIPDSGFLIPDSPSRIPDCGSRIPDPTEKSVPPRAKSRPSGSPGKSAAAFEAYASAYLLRYGVDPRRNAKVNGQLAKLVNRIGAEEAPAVAAFYVQHNRALYVSSRHCTDLLLRDAEGLRTEWATGRRVTETEARHADRTQANGDVWGKLIAETGR